MERHQLTTIRSTIVNDLLVVISERERSDTTDTCTDTDTDSWQLAVGSVGTTRQFFFARFTSQRQRHEQPSFFRISGVRSGVCARGRARRR